MANHSLIRSNSHLTPSAPTSYLNKNEKKKWTQKREEIFFVQHYSNSCTSDRMWRPTYYASAYRGRADVVVILRKNAGLYQIHRSLDVVEEMLPATAVVSLLLL